MTRRGDKIASALLDSGVVTLPGDAWRHRARCRDLDPELWFPVGNGPAALKQAAAAKSICGLCPVRAQCLASAMATETSEWMTFGIWGGLDESERRAARARQRKGRPMWRPPRKPRRW